MQGILIVVTGPTGSGKTDLAIRIASALGCEIISADSRQIYKDIPIGTAAPSKEQLATVPHHFVGTLNLDEYYSAARFEQDVLELLPRLWEKSPYVVMCGGSMMYIDAVCNGIDNLPEVSPEIRTALLEKYRSGGIEYLRETLKGLDPIYYASVDLNNHKRIFHAIEITIQANAPYSSLLTGTKKIRPWKTIKIAPQIPRDELFKRINARVNTMIDAGWEDEVAAVYHLRHLNSLNTVGYKELFAVIDGRMDRDTAIARIAKNTRVYAKKQLTWLKKASDINYIPAGESGFESAMKLILS